MGLLLRALKLAIEIILLPILFIAATFGRFCRKRIDVGLGPEPLINNIYHKQALELYGYTAQTFVSHVYVITDKFDVRGDKIFPSKYPRIQNVLSQLYLFLLSLQRYKSIYIYFSGGPIGNWTSLLWRIEPFLYKLAKVKVVVMPYGSDVQDMSRSPNLLFKDALSSDYPQHKFRRRIISSKIDLWTKYADHVIGGCEWVYYMYHWDTLVLAHFSIDAEAWRVSDKKYSFEDKKLSEDKKLRILHAPNHKTIKGTRYFVDTVSELIREGIGVELILLEKVPNDEVKKIMATVDVVADQLIVGWYAMFAIEAMAMEKPVLCYLREDLKELYTALGLVAADEIPIINCSPSTVKEAIKDLALNRGKLREIGKRSREYVIRHHSTKAMGEVFDRINRSIGVKPSGKPV